MEAVVILPHVLTLKVASDVSVMLDTLEMDSTALVSDINLTK